MPNLKRQWTVAERDELPDDGNRYEVIDGELFVTPAPSWKHQEAAYKLHRILTDYLITQPVGYAVGAPADVVFSPRRGVQPDVFVVPLVNGRKPRHFDEVRRLLLAVEVLSPGTARADRVAKRTLYADEGVAEYWIVDLDARAVDRFTLNDPRPEVLSEQIVWSPEGTTEPLVVNLEQYFEEVLDR